jgi:hypothetical protein
MKIRELFKKKIDRPIEGVIKADDRRFLRTEFEEYVVTRDVAKGLSTFTERYLEDPTANGVWISGFFGCGKSHLLKVLSYVLDSRPLEDGIRPADIVLSKVDDEIVRAALQKAAAIPATSLLFNIDQVFDGIGGDRTAPILEVFVKVFNELEGYYGKLGYIAAFERSLDSHGDLEPFKATYLKVNNSPWDKDRESIMVARRSHFAKAYATHFGVPEKEAMEVLSHARQDYRVSVESFANLVKDYVSRQPAGFRLNFFVDEAGQFIGQDSKLMLNLQTITETLATACDNRAWVFVTSQADLEGVLGAFKGLKAEDISKIQGRFKTRVTLASADVKEVIQKRLLEKHEDEPEVITEIFDREKDNLQTLYRFGDGSQTFNGWRGSDQFCGFYPFHPYQFDLFQKAIQQLSAHNAFTGRYQSVGERPMLAVFQDVAKKLMEAKVGRLATFDLLYDGLASTLRGDMQTSISMADRQLGDGIEVRILKALFLVKWVREFKATSRNVAILLIDSPDIDIKRHEKDVREALAHLESQSYLQRSGDCFEFLTDTEKDIEVEIKNTDIDESAVTALLGNALFADTLKDAKIRYEGNGQDYPYARKLDDHVVGRDAEVAVNVVTTEHPNHSAPEILAMQNVGKPELLAVLPADSRLIEQAILHEKTRKYVQQHPAGGDDTRKAILDQRAQQNGTRRTVINELASELLSQAPVYLNGTRLENIGQGDARNRFAKACQDLVAFAYPNLRMLKGAYDENTLSQALLAQDDLFGGNAPPLSEAEQEILTHASRQHQRGERTTVEELRTLFGKRPYGWPAMAVLTLVARVFRMGKLELRAPDLLDARSALEQLKNTRQHSGIRVSLQQQFDAATIKALQKFHEGFFDKSNEGTDARSVAEATTKALGEEAADLRALLAQADRYKFLAALQPVADKVAKLAKNDHTYLLTKLDDFKNDLLGDKEDLISPLKTFMKGPQRTAYDEAMAFLRKEEANFGELPPDEVKPLRDLEASEAPYRGNVIPAARKAIEQLRPRLATLLTEERTRAIASLDELECMVKQTPDFLVLEPTQAQEVLELGVDARTAVEQASLVAVIRDRASRYAREVYPKQLTLASSLAAKAAESRNGGNGGGHVPKPEVAYTRLTKLLPKGKGAYLATSEDVDDWLRELRKAMEAEISRGNRITL